MLRKAFMPDDNHTPEQKKIGKTDGGLRSLVEAERLLQIIFVLPSAVAICGFLGALADWKLHQSWMMIAGLIFGAIAGMYYVVRLAFDAERRAAMEDAKGEKKESGSSNLGNE